jgi:uncharacterized protein
MKYTRFPGSGIKASRFGMGCMRLPMMTDSKGKSVIDEKESVSMIRYAADNGVNYFDTAYAYVGSEEVLGKALAGGLREKVIIATKCPTWNIKGSGDFDRFLLEELSRLRTEYIDFYLLHALGKANWEKVEKFGLLEKLDEAKKKGIIKYAAFSFHDDLKTFKKIVDSYPFDMCQIQLNFLQEDYQAGVEGMKYAASKNMGVVIMEPLMGGLLGNAVPDEFVKQWDASGIKRTPAEWGFRWVADFKEATVILSGVNTMEQLEEDIAIFSDVLPGSLTDKEVETYKKLKGLYQEKLKVACTGCAYCMPCPSGVDIPTVFRFYNNTFLGGEEERWKKTYRSFLGKKDADASQCSECGQCQEACPQDIDIIERLKEAHEYMMSD